jgi:hypothetical protein
MESPVFVCDENVFYHSDSMEEGKLYPIVWKGEKWALRKTDYQVEFMKWEAGHD